MVPSITRILSAASSAISSITAPGGRGRMVSAIFSPYTSRRFSRGLHFPDVKADQPGAFTLYGWKCEAC